jgi:hypothetical protein
MKETTLAPNLKQVYSEKLKTLKDGLTPADKQKCITELNYCRQTIEDYLKGNVNKVSTAEDLINFFNPIVMQRLSKLQTA